MDAWQRGSYLWPMFAGIPGQEKLKQTLAQMAAQQRMPHALLLRGPDGVGKLPLALQLAAWLNCGQQEVPNDPRWKQITRLEHPDVRVVPPLFAKTVDGKKLTSDDFAAEFRQFIQQQPWGLLDAWGELLYDSKTFTAKGEGGKNKQFNIPIDEIRLLHRRLQLRPQPGSQRVVILWHAEKLNINAANAFLKLLEEPPEHTLLILTAGEGSLLLPTITSRCQSLVFERLPAPHLQQWLEQDHAVPTPLAEELALVADGSPSRALALAQTTENPFRQAFMDWMRMCYEGKEDRIADFAEQMRGHSLEYQRRFLEFSLQKLRDALAHVAGVPQLALATAAEQQFLARFSQFMGLGSIELLEQHIEEALRQATGYVHSPLLFTVLSHRAHQAMGAAAP